MSDDLVEIARIYGCDLTSHPAANGTVEHTERAGQMIRDLVGEIDSLRAAVAAERSGSVIKDSLITAAAFEECAAMVYAEASRSPDRSVMQERFRALAAAIRARATSPTTT